MARRNYRPEVELLETRNLLAPTATFLNGVLTITGSNDPADPDTIQLTRNDTTGEVFLNGG